MANKSISHVAKLLNSKSTNVILLSGAGVSTASGIPDFRSAGGMYDTLQPELLTASETEKALMERDPTYVVSWDIFKDNQLPYLELRRPFILGLHEEDIWRPTIYHAFSKLLFDKQKLLRSYTQNIDGLDYKLSVPPQSIISCHGSLATIACEGCGAPMETNTFTNLIKTQIKDIYKTDPSAPASSTPINCPSCSKPLVKPSTVLYGRNLPAEFHENAQSDASAANLLIVAGTSLTVYPAASLPELAGGILSETTRLVVDRDKAAGYRASIDIKNNPKDIMLEGDCDSVFLDLIEEAGWLEDLTQYKDSLCESSKRLLDGRLLYLEAKGKN
jgi:NAD-dependent SIR2 family protein deacetylase|mmetsp:Transcript_340/g.581  ORF Transcript_340/g.581 Transcript_340/m.581 type:complete len:331 (+) Transcript_340:1-993(+)